MEWKVGHLWVAIAAKASEGVGEPDLEAKK